MYSPLSLFSTREIMDQKFIILGICLLLTLGIEADSDEEFRRALEEFEELLDETEQQEEKRNIFEANHLDDLVPDSIGEKFQCKQLGEGCRGLPKCCGKSQCYWENGFSLLKKGECVTCINETQKCLRSENCCGDLICYRVPKITKLSLDGVCTPKLSGGGKCFKDKQCASGVCHKKWYEFLGGICTATSRPELS